MRDGTGAELDVLRADQTLADLARSDGSPEAIAQALIGKGRALLRLDRDAEAATCLADALARLAPGTDSQSGLAAEALHHRGRALAALERFEEADEAFLQAAALVVGRDDEASHQRHARVLRSRGHALLAAGNYDGAMAVADELARLVADRPVKDWPELGIQAGHLKARILARLGHHEDALAAIGDVINRHAADSHPDVREALVLAMTRKAELLTQAGRDQDALTAYRDLIDRFDGDEADAVRVRVAAGRKYLGDVLRRLDRHEEAIAAYEQAIVSGDDERFLDIAMFARLAIANCVRALGRTDEASTAYLAIAGDGRAGQSLRVRVVAAHALLLHAETVRDQGDWRAVIADCDRLLATFGRDTERAMRKEIARAYALKGFALERLERDEEAVVTYEAALSQFRAAEHPTVDVDVAGIRRRYRVLKRRRRLHRRLLSSLHR